MSSQPPATEADPADGNPWQRPVAPPPPPPDPWIASQEPAPNPWLTPAPLDEHRPDQRPPDEHLTNQHPEPAAMALAEPGFGPSTTYLGAQHPGGADTNPSGPLPYFGEPAVTPFTDINFGAYPQALPDLDPRLAAYRFGEPLDLTLPVPSSYPTAVDTVGRPPRPRTSIKAVLGMALGLVALICCFLSFLDAFLIVPAVVLCILGLRETSTGRTGRGLAIAGLVFATIAAVAALAFVVFAVSRASSCADHYHRGSTDYNSCLITGR